MSRRWRPLIEIPILVGLAVSIVVVTRWVLVQPFYIPSESMVPQLAVNDKVIVSRMSYRLHAPNHGDVVVFDEPPSIRPPAQHHAALAALARWVGERLGLSSRTDEFIKRVIALPGETVTGHDGHVYLNGRLLLEPYLPPGTETDDFATVHVPAGELWVMGDNRTNSEDSRTFGPIRESTVVGRAVLRVWPVSRLAFL